MASIEKTTTDWYWDLQVPATNNYMMGGAVHHNCLHGDTLVQMADGSLEPIRNLADREVKVMGFDAPAVAFGVRSGVKPLYEIELGNGRRIKCTADHKWMTQDGWKKTSDLEPSFHRIRSPRQIAIKPHRLDITAAEALWAGIFLSAGTLHKTWIPGTEDNQFIFIKNDPEKVLKFKVISNVIGIECEVINNVKSVCYAKVLESQAIPLFEKLGIKDPLSCKRIPAPILQSNNWILRHFLQGVYLSCSIKNAGRNTSNISIGISSHRNELLTDVMLSLQRFGVRSKITLNEKNGYDLWIRGKANLIAFNENVGFCFDELKNKINAAIEVIKYKYEKSHSDFLPVNYGDALNWTKRHKVSIGKGRYAKWCARENSDLRVTHGDVKKFLELWPHMKAHAWEIFYDDDSIWEEVRSVRDLRQSDETFDLIVPGDNSFLASGVLSHNSGKSTFSHLVVLRMLYEASCLKNPAVSYGLAPNSVIGFCSLAKSKETARRVVFEQLAAKIQESPYFKYEFPPVKDLKDEIIFPKGLAIICGSSTDTSIIGMNIFGGIIDEVNFWGRVKKSNLNYGKHWGSESKSGRLFDSVRRRMKSRYIKKGKLPGIIMLISSKTTKDSFTEQFIRKEQALGNNSTFVRDRSILDMKRDSFGSKVFRVLIGTVDYPSRILAEGEDVSHLKDVMTIEIPDDFRVDFENNLEEALRDIAGVSTIAISNFISKVDRINDMIDHSRTHPFVCALMDNPMSWDSRKPYRINWDMLCKRKDNGEWVPRLNPEAPRHVHFDPAYTGDAFGLCMGHISHMEAVQHDGEIVEYKPHFVLDFMLEIQGTKDEEVLNYKVRELCYEFVSHGFHIAEFSMDTYQSREMIQALEQLGFKAGIYSVDTGNSTKGENVINTAVGRVPKAKQAYWYLRSVIYEGRIKCYDYPKALGELRRLEDGPEKVDHPEGESKDLADAICGCVWTLFRSKMSGEVMAPSKGISISPAVEQESLSQYQDSIIDVTPESYRDVMPSPESEELKATKVYHKKKPQSVGPKYQKVSTSGEVKDLRVNADDFLMRG